METAAPVATGTRALHVVTHRTWVASDLASGAGPDVEASPSLGMDVPAFAPGDTAWAPMEWMARALHDERLVTDPTAGPGTSLSLEDPGADFLPRLSRLAPIGADGLMGEPGSLTGRRVESGTLAEFLLTGLGGGHTHGFIKPANCKIDFFDAKWRSAHDVARIASVHDLTPYLALHWSTTRLDLAEEHRVWIIKRPGDTDGGDQWVPITSSPYLIHPHDIDGHPDSPITWHEQMRSHYRHHAESFAGTVAAAAAEAWGSLPSAFVLDVGLLAGHAPSARGSWVVVEANPAWSAGFYGAEMTAVVECLFAAAKVAPSGVEVAGQWTWRPDPYLLERVRRQRPLRT